MEFLKEHMMPFKENENSYLLFLFEKWSLYFIASSNPLISKSGFVLLAQADKQNLAKYSKLLLHFIALHPFSLNVFTNKNSHFAAYVFWLIDWCWRLQSKFIPIGEKRQINLFEKHCLR